MCSSTQCSHTGARAHTRALRCDRYGHSFSGFDNRFLVLVPGKLFVFGGKVGRQYYPTLSTAQYLV